MRRQIPARYFHRHHNIGYDTMRCRPQLDRGKPGFGSHAHARMIKGFKTKRQVKEEQSAAVGFLVKNLIGSDRG